jgi:hypothetical protein
MRGSTPVAAFVAMGITASAIALVVRPGSAPSDSTRTSAEEPRCRCAPLDLADYYETADEVALARLVAFEEDDMYRVLRMVLEAPRWKTFGTDRSSHGIRGDTVEYRTAVSTATCGVVPELEAVYAVFGAWSPRDSVLDVDSCSGTRVHRSAGGEGALGGFQDVPGRFVVRQLDALGGLDALEALTPLPDPAAPDYAVVRGLLDLEPLAHGGIVRVLEWPDDEAPVLATIGDVAAVVTREVGYEVAAAVVFGRVDGWSRVRLTDGRSGWIAPDEAGTWFPYADLPLRRLAYLTPAWSGWIWPEPGAGIPARVARTSGHEREQPVDVLESRLLGGLPWFRVTVLDGSPCEGPDAPRPSVGGWVPGYGVHADGTGLEPTVWYWSRGC